MPFFETDLPEEWIKFFQNLKAFLKVKNITNCMASYAVAKTLLREDALNTFKTAERT